MDLFQASAVLITLAALFNYLNYKYLKLPAAIGIMAMALVLSLVVLALGTAFPAISLGAEVMLRRAGRPPGKSSRAERRCSAAEEGDAHRPSRAGSKRVGAH